LSHSGCVLEDGTVYLWGISGDIQQGKEYMDRCLLKTPTKISFKNSGDNGNVSHRRRSTAQDDGSSSIFIEDLKLGEQFSMALSNKGIVYTWGQNDKGQLGLGNEISTWEP
jgi:alpha-tubulin suppressor-like RCC1 family protein